ncbi:MORN repeat, putative [Trypanosoma equiperdum]|uniref:MORN repeat n=2 Tax=Trypanozoon TaxID=39700 RepID=Q580L5_TRYB2|nr:hypothetical protein, conserved [Trypanosoma brucei brucei TREU927]AAX79332.1 hypothetical protein, conserved [Trypanosoma brucei]AAZ10460.1 hypothetical protein, conserved [Trypanosoma brucei brucei TREU927]SCU68683.1 MORN repeat, putative [Trypanosoma equiperdum]
MGHPSDSRYRGETRQKSCGADHAEVFWKANRATYTGMWRDDRPHGKGTYVLPGENGFTYEGNFFEGDRNGSGICVFSDGRRYEGGWLKDNMHGMGILFGNEESDDFVDYTGPFANGKRRGQDGTCRYKNGSVYKGEWLDDKRHGRGELEVGKNASIPGYKPIPGESHVSSYVGTFVDDVPKGAGTLKYSDGSTYEGEIEGLHRHGKGVHRSSTGCVFKGSFECDRRHGPGVMIISGAEYRGEWHYGSLEGVVTITGDKIPRADPSLVYYCGPAVRGELTGDNAVIEYREGYSYRGSVRMSKPHGKGVLLKKPVTLPEIGDFILQYDGEFVAGLPKGSGEGVFLAANPDTDTLSEESPLEPRGFLPKYNFSGRYKGSWTDGLPNGKGQWIWDQIDRTYCGDVLRGFPHGEGTLTCSSVSYTGSFVKGLPNGTGKASWTVGASVENTYEGGWKEGYFDGEGLLKLHGGYSYKGQWSKGLVDGLGTEIVPYERTYTGKFSQGNKHGEGKLCLIRSGEVYEGNFISGEMTGAGKMTTREGHILKGEFINGKMSGDGEAIHKNGTVFQGKYRNGAAFGTGRILYAHGDVYEGGIVSSGDLIPHRDGPGVYMFFEGGKLECTWKRNVLVGEGLYTSSNGIRSRRSYTEGILDFDELIDKVDPATSGDLSDAVSKHMSTDTNTSESADISAVGIKICRSLPSRKACHGNVSLAVCGSPNTGSPPFGGVKPVPPACVEKQFVPLPQIQIQTPRRDGEASLADPYPIGQVRVRNAGQGSPSFSPKSPSAPFLFPGPRMSGTNFSLERDALVRTSASTMRNDSLRPLSPPLCLEPRVASSNGQRFPALSGSVVRNSGTPDHREHEIRRLTESLQNVNDRIWTAKTARSATWSSADPVTPEKKPDPDSLQTLQQERRTALQDLASLM